MGNDADTGSASDCDVTVVALVNASSGGDMSVTSSCEAVSCPALMLSNDTVAGPEMLQSCQIHVGGSYSVVGPSGNLTLSAVREVRIGGGFSVGNGARLTIEMDPNPLP